MLFLPVAMQLWCLGVISGKEYILLKSARSLQDGNRRLLDLVREKGAGVQELFVKLLAEDQPYLCNNDNYKLVSKIVGQGNEPRFK